MPIPLRLASDAPSRERLLHERLAGDPELRARVVDAVAEAFVLGLLDLARLPQDTRAAHLAACAAVPFSEPCGRAALARWHRQLGGTGAWRRSPVEGAAPPEFVEDRLVLLEDWLGTDGGRELQPSAAGALVLARVLEIEPFEDLNTSVALLAARHVMQQRGALGPVLLEEDRGALRAAVPAARAFETRPLADVLEAGAARALELAAKEIERSR